MTVEFHLPYWSFPASLLPLPMLLGEVGGEPHTTFPSPPTTTIGLVTSLPVEAGPPTGLGGDEWQLLPVPAAPLLTVEFVDAPGGACGAASPLAVKLCVALSGRGYLERCWFGVAMSSFFYFNSFPQGLSLFLPLLVPDVWLVGYASVSVGFFTGRSSQRLPHDSQTPVLLVKNWQRRRGRGETHSVANVQQDACANVYINQVATPPPFFPCLG